MPRTDWNSWLGSALIGFILYWVGAIHANASPPQESKVHYSDVYLVDLIEDQDRTGLTPDDRTELKYLDTAAKNGKPIRIHRVGPQEMAKFLNGDQAVFQGHTAQGPSKVIVTGHGCPGCSFVSNMTDSANSPTGKRYSVDQLASLVHTLVPNQKEPVKISLRSCSGGLGQPGQQGTYEQSLAHSLGAKLSSQYQMGTQISGRMGLAVSSRGPLPEGHNPKKIKEDLRKLAKRGLLPATDKLHVATTEIGNARIRHQVIGPYSPEIRLKTRMQGGQLVSAKENPSAKVAVHTAPGGDQKTLFPTSGQTHAELRKGPQGPKHLSAMNQAYARAQGVDPALVRSEKEKAAEKAAAKEAEAKKFRAERVKRKKIDYSDVYLVDVRKDRDRNVLTADDRTELKYLDQASKTGKPIRVHRIGPQELARFLEGDKDVFRGRTAQGPSKVIITGAGCPGCDFISDSPQGKRYGVDQLAKLVHELVPMQSESVKISLRSGSGGLGKPGQQGAFEQSLAHSLGAKLSSEYKMGSQISGRTGGTVSYESTLTVQDPQEVRRNLRSLASAGDLPATGRGPHGLKGFADPSLRLKTLMEGGRMVTAKQDPAAKVTVHTTHEGEQKTLAAGQSHAELKKGPSDVEAEQAKAKAKASGVQAESEKDLAKQARKATQDAAKVAKKGQAERRLAEKAAAAKAAETRKAQAQEASAEKAAIREKDRAEKDAARRKARAEKAAARKKAQAEALKLKEKTPPAEQTQAPARSKSENRPGTAPVANAVPEAKPRTPPPRPALPKVPLAQHPVVASEKKTPPARPAAPPSVEGAKKKIPPARPPAPHAMGKENIPVGETPLDPATRSPFGKAEHRMAMRRKGGRYATGPKVPVKNALGKGPSKVGVVPTIGKKKLGQRPFRPLR